MNFIYDHCDNRDIHVPHKYHELLGDDEFMRRYYSQELSIKTGGILFRVFEKANEGIENVPNYVIEISGIQKDFICFESAKDVKSYLCIIQPNI